MHESDRADFSALLQSVAAYYDRKLVPATMAIYWQGLADLPLDAVRVALNSHAQDPQSGQFMPKIADIRRAIESSRDDGHPGADEAWSIALQARHESASVVWTDQIAQAFFVVAMPLLDAGDKIAARRAFIERYEHELAEARKAGMSAKWIASLGSDPEQRTSAVEQAVRQGRIASEHAQKVLPRPEPMTSAAVRMLENGVRATAGSAADERAQIAKLRALLRLPQ